MEKLKFKHLDGVFGMFWFFGILKTSGFVGEKKSDIVATIMTKHANIFS